MSDLDPPIFVGCAGFAAADDGSLIVYVEHRYSCSGATHQHKVRPDNTPRFLNALSDLFGSAREAPDHEFEHVADDIWDELPGEIKYGPLVDDDADTYPDWLWAIARHVTQNAARRRSVEPRVVSGGDA